MANGHCVVMAQRPWTYAAFDSVFGGLTFGSGITPTPYKWHVCRNIEDAEAIAPRLVFFPHWSQYVPRAFVERFYCVGFHESALPEGRGGSPIQHEILAGKTETMLTAFRMTDQMDAGPILLQCPISLAGRAEDIYWRVATRAQKMMIDIAMFPFDFAMVEKPQRGDVTIRERRRPAESEIPETIDTDDRLYDFLRMLDCSGYPAAFLIHGRYRYEFTQVHQADGAITAQVRITPSVAHV